LDTSCMSLAGPSTFLLFMMAVICSMDKVFPSTDKHA
jgi:hypothetical protein